MASLRWHPDPSLSFTEFPIPAQDSSFHREESGDRSETQTQQPHSAAIPRGDPEETHLTGVVEASVGNKSVTSEPGTADDSDVQQAPGTQIEVDDDWLFPDPRSDDPARSLRPGCTIGPKDSTEPKGLIQNITHESGPLGNSGPDSNQALSSHTSAGSAPPHGAVFVWNPPQGGRRAGTMADPNKTEVKPAGHVTSVPWAVWPQPTRRRDVLLTSDAVDELPTYMSEREDISEPNGLESEALADGQPIPRDWPYRGEGTLQVGATQGVPHMGNSEVDRELPPDYAATESDDSYYVVGPMEQDLVPDTRKPRCTTACKTALVVIPALAGASGAILWYIMKKVIRRQEYIHG